MKVLFVVWMLCFGNISVDAFTSSSTSRTAIRKSGFHDIRKYHHMGDLDHDELAEEDGHFFSNPTSFEKEEAPDVVLYDNVAVALDDEAYDMAMKSVIALFVAVAVAFAGPGIFRPRPVLAVEPMNFSARDDAPTVMVRSAESSNDFRAPYSITSSWMSEQK
eukprot:CAMPEP_0197278652 /NCGR_PEP_ID=MMETSP1432-20130617/18990_1 /TAXON_ID=44447 /ORGANISM="Pseudo-nitzschia delicatissima, Strain UNC1205" /LENGTH=161 /DNA_ID=CAMNT_0042745067 /DNA_START=7 /DNA_END=492 /DNA_ORIENTATION=-